MVAEHQQEVEREELGRLLITTWAGIVDPSQEELAQEGALAGLDRVEKLLFDEQFSDSVQALVMDWGQEMDSHTPLGM